MSIHAAISDGDLHRARREWEQVYPLIDAIMAQPFGPAVKTALNATGFAIGSPRPPACPLDPEVAATITRLAAPFSPSSMPETAAVV